MTDRELLELAAKAAGIEIIRWNEMLSAYETNIGLWNALYNDGDALRLAVRLELIVSIYDAEVVGPWSVEKMHEADKYEATRRAIVRAAAEIGRGME